MNGQTVSSYNLSDSQEPEEIATVKGETDLTEKGWQKKWK